MIVRNLFLPIVAVREADICNSSCLTRIFQNVS
jgi:hypothetical protein